MSGFGSVCQIGSGPAQAGHYPIRGMCTDTPCGILAAIGGASLRFVVLFFVLAVLLGYYFIYNGGQYFRFLLTEVVSIWRSIESSVKGLF